MTGTGRIPFLPIPRGGKIQIPETGMCNLELLLPFLDIPSQFSWAGMERAGMELQLRPLCYFPTSAQDSVAVHVTVVCVACYDG